MLVGAFVMVSTRFGRTVYAVGGSEQSARLMGLNVARTKVLVYVISGTCGGLAGLVLTAYSGAGYPRNGIGTELDVIAAVVIGGTLLSGGTGYVLGSMIGVFVYGTIKTVISFLGAEQSWTRIIIGLLLLLFIVVQRVIVVPLGASTIGIARHRARMARWTRSRCWSCTGATVYFGVDAALDAVDFRLFPGEVHSLMGENGAGKSTLIKAITGALPLVGRRAPARRHGRPVRLARTTRSRRASARSTRRSTCCPTSRWPRTSRLGREPRRFGMIDWARDAIRRAQAVLKRPRSRHRSASLLGQHSLAVQQLVAIARAISTDVRVLVLDEPTSSLDTDECAELFRVVRDLKQRGVAILFVSHFLDQVYEISDRVTVLRDGKLVGEFLTKELLRIDLVQAMLGRSAEPRCAPGPGCTSRRSRSGVPSSAPAGCTVGAGIDDADVDLMEGEVLGVAGLLGSGRTELARAITGLDKLDAGIVHIQGQPVRLAGPRTAIVARCRLLVGEPAHRRHHQRAERPGEHHPGAAGRARLPAAAPPVPPARARAELDRRAGHPAGRRRIAVPGTLSGGNQQKVLLARLLALSPRALVLDEPTRGIDIGAKVQVQNLVGELADNGLSVMFISAELEEVLRVGQPGGDRAGRTDRRHRCRPRSSPSTP